MGKEIKIIMLVAVIFALGLAWPRLAMAFVFGGKSYDGEYELHTRTVEEMREELYLVAKDGREQIVYASQKRFVKGTYWSNIKGLVRWSWDNQMFLFWVYAGPKSELGKGHQLDLWVGEILADETVQVRKVAEQASAASISPDGSKIMLERLPETGRGGWYLLDLATGEEKLMSTRVSGSGSSYDAPEWTADGRYVFFVYYEMDDPRRDPHYRHNYWVLDLKAGTEHQLKLADPEKPILRTPQTPIFPSARGNLMLAGFGRFNEIPGELWELKIDLATKSIIGGRKLMNCECESDALVWVKPGELVSYGRTMLDLTGDEVKIIGQEQVSWLGEEAVLAGPCPVTDPKLYQVKYIQPVSSSPGRCISSFFSHSDTDSCADGTFRYDCVDTGRTNHLGTDFAAGYETAIKAAASGIVSKVFNQCANHLCDDDVDTCGGGRGNYVEIRHPNEAGVMKTHYFHMKSDITLKKDDQVGANQLIGHVGDTGRSMGCHLHFEMRYKEASAPPDQITPVDPFYGDCNWITESLWVDQGGLLPPCQ